MLRFILMALLAWQSMALAMTMQAWRTRHRQFWDWRWRLLAEPSATHADWCAHAASSQTERCALSLTWLGDSGDWQNICEETPYRHRAGRYWRLTIQCRLEGPWLRVNLPVTEGVIFR